MEPLIKSGDTIVVELSEEGKGFRVGDIIVYKDSSSQKLFAHRLIKEFNENGRCIYLTQSHYGWRACRVTAGEIIGKVALLIRGGSFINPRAGFFSFHFHRLLSSLKHSIFRNIRDYSMRLDFPGTMLLSIPYWRAVQSILRTDVFLSLKREGYRVVILSPFAKNGDFIKEFSGKNIFFEGIKEFRFASGLDKIASMMAYINKVFFSFPFPKSLAELAKLVFDPNSRTFKIKKFVLIFSLIILARLSLILLLFFLSMFFAFFIKTGILKKESVINFPVNIAYKFAAFVYSIYLIKIFLKYKFNLICITRIFDSPIENFLVTIGKFRKIPSLGIHTNLDGVVSLNSDRFNALPPVNKLIVWSEAIKQEFKKHRIVDGKDIIAAGYPAHDVYFNLRKKEELFSRDEFFRFTGMDKERKLIIFAEPYRAPERKEDYDTFIDYLCDCIRENKFIFPSQAIIRLHPTQSLNYYNHWKNKIGNSKYISIELANVKFMNNGDAAEAYKKDMKYLAGLLMYADLLIVGRSGFSIDGAIFDTPMLSVIPNSIWPDISLVSKYGKKLYSIFGSDRKNLLFKKDKVAAIDKMANDVFGKYVLPSGGVRNVNSLEEFIPYVNDYLKDPSLGSQGRKDVVDQLCGKIDGNVSKRIVEVIKSFLPGA